MTDLTHPEVKAAVREYLDKGQVIDVASARIIASWWCSPLHPYLTNFADGPAGPSDEVYREVEALINAIDANADTGTELEYLNALAAYVRDNVAYGVTVPETPEEALRLLAADES